MTLQRKKYRYNVEQVQYAGTDGFEQALDIYRPEEAYQADSTDNAADAAAVASTDAEGKPPMIVVLVGGSAWMGRIAPVYWMTSWWNSSGPKVITSKHGVPCVCIRHRGAFPHLSLAECITIMLVLTIVLLQQQRLGDTSDAGEEQPSIHFGKVALGEVIGVTVLLLMRYFASTAANFDDMTSDVLAALKWVHSNTHYVLHQDATTQGDAQKPLIVFGGYSSGGHVAASVLSFPERRWKAHGLPIPELWMDSVLMLSGVLAVAPTPSAEQQRQWQQQKQMIANANASSPTIDPDTKLSADVKDYGVDTSFAWFQEWLVSKVFGHTSASIPSPLFEYNIPNIPHYLVECENEMALPILRPILGVFFSSTQYAQMLADRGITCIHKVLVSGDHWTILDTAEFDESLGDCFECMTEGNDDDHDNGRKVIMNGSQRTSKKHI